MKMNKKKWSWMVALLGPLIVAGSLSADPAYPVKVGPTGRYLVDQNGVPFLITGDSPQAMIGNLSEAEAELFLSNRRAYGFNTVWINLLCTTYTGCRDDGMTFDGVPPFTTLLANSPAPYYDLSTPNEDYFARVDRILQLAAQYGFLVILDPAETGGWLDVLRNNGIAASFDYGRFLGQRYAGYDNILWIYGNDYDPNPSDDLFVGALASGIRERDTRHLHTLELNRFSTSRDAEQLASVIGVDLDAAYSDVFMVGQVLKAYNRPNSLPTFTVEAGYEFQMASTLALRAQEYWVLLSGAAGQLYGNDYTWPFVPGWQDHLDTPGSVQMTYVKALFEPRAWYDLVPDQGHTVVTDGVGITDTVDYATAARTLDGTLVMAYVPSIRPVTVDMSQLSGSVTARWYDPSAGTFAAVAGSPFPNSGLLIFTAPGINADGDQDWVLVLEASQTQGVSAITPNPIDLAAAPNSFTISGAGFVSLGAALPVVNFVANGVLVGQARATGLTGGTLTVPFPTDQTSLSGPLAGFSAGSVTVTVHNQTLSGFTLVGSTNLTVHDTRCTTCAVIAPNPIDLAATPNSFAISGGSFADLGAGLPVVNFVANGVLVGQARATGLTGGTLTVPFPTDQTSLSGPLAGFSAGSVTVTVHNQTLSGFTLVGSTNLTVHDTRCTTCAVIAPNPIDLAAAPNSFTISGGSFANLGAGLPVVNFVANGFLVGQARATGLTGGMLTVPIPTDQTSLSGPLAGLSPGSVTVFVYNQTPLNGFILAGSIGLTVR